jgi:hypothetical protein
LNCCQQGKRLIEMRMQRCIREWLRFILIRHGFSCYNAGLNCRSVVCSVALPGGSLAALQSVRWAGPFRFSFAADSSPPATA